MGLLVLFCFFSSENEYISNWWLIKEGFAIISRAVGSHVFDIHSPQRGKFGLRAASHNGNSARYFPAVKVKL